MIDGYLIHAGIDNAMASTGLNPFDRFKRNLADLGCNAQQSYDFKRLVIVNGREWSSFVS
jgi:hypothetical protein